MFKVSEVWGSRKLTNYFGFVLGLEFVYILFIAGI